MGPSDAGAWRNDCKQGRERQREGLPWTASVDSKVLAKKTKQLNYSLPHLHAAVRLQRRHSRVKGGLLLLAQPALAAALDAPQHLQDGALRALRLRPGSRGAARCVSRRRSGLATAGRGPLQK